MKKIALLTTLFLSTALSAKAELLKPREADAICRAKAVRAAQFIMEKKQKFSVKYKAADIYEISTPITYEFYVPGIVDSLVTVHAYAYPDDHSCTIGVISNNLAGND